MIVRLQALVSWFEGRPPRERAGIAIAAAVLLTALYDAAWWSPQRQLAADLRSDIEALATEKSVLESELARLEQRESTDPDAALERQVDVMQQRIARLDEELRGQTLQILTPQQMPAVLRDLIEATDRLRIVGIRSEAPQLLVEGTDDKQPILYRHGLVMDLKGEYLALLDCIRALEALPWRLYWLGLEVRADGTGGSDFRLHVYTVSLREEWISV